MSAAFDIHRRLIPVAKADAKLLRAECLDHAVAADGLAARRAAAQREREQQHRDPFAVFQGKPSQRKKSKKAHRTPMRFFIIPNIPPVMQEGKTEFSLTFSSRTLIVAREELLRALLLRVAEDRLGCALLDDDRRRP